MLARAEASARRHGHAQGPPIFSTTTFLTSEGYRDLVEDSTENWLIQFYHDWSDQCKEFAPRWEALASKLPPMVRLARINIDQNFGLVQRYRSFVRCRQTAFFMECTAPAIVLVTPSADGSMQARSPTLAPSPTRPPAGVAREIPPRPPPRPSCRACAAPFSAPRASHTP